MDRNFDDLAERFEQRIYGGLKGQIRLAVLWRDLQQYMPQSSFQSLRVLDLGGGLGQLSIRLAEQGCRIVFNELSEKMLSKAINCAKHAGVEKQFEWRRGAYQELELEAGRFDLILCHALLEWVDSPDQLIELVAGWLQPQGFLSLCYYNPAAKVYRNLIRGNFDWIDRKAEYQSNDGSLTPNNPCERPEVLGWLQRAGLQVKGESGIRVFSDYVVEKRGGLQSEPETIEMEMAFSHREPYKWLGRYLHIIAKK